MLNGETWIPFLLNQTNDGPLVFRAGLQPAALNPEVSAGADCGKFSAELHSVVSVQRTAVWGRGPSQGPFVSKR